MTIDIEGIQMYVSSDENTMTELLHSIAYILFNNYICDRKIDQSIDYIGIKMIGQKSNVLTPFSKN